MKMSRLFERAEAAEERRDEYLREWESCLADILLLNAEKEVAEQRVEAELKAAILRAEKAGQALTQTVGVLKTALMEIRRAGMYSGSPAPVTKHLFQLGDIVSAALRILEGQEEKPSGESSG